MAPRQQSQQAATQSLAVARPLQLWSTQTIRMMPERVIAHFLQSARQHAALQLQLCESLPILAECPQLQRRAVVTSKEAQSDCDRGHADTDLSWPYTHAFLIAQLYTKVLIGWYRIHDSVFDTLHTLQVDDDGVHNEAGDKEKEP